MLSPNARRGASLFIFLACLYAPGCGATHDLMDSADAFESGRDGGWPGSDASDPSLGDPQVNGFEDAGDQDPVNGFEDAGDPISDVPTYETDAGSQGDLGAGTCCADGDCVCRGNAPTEASASGKGPFQVDQYTEGFRDGPKFGAATIYYPTDAEPPLSGIVMCPGYTADQRSIAAWGPFFASHGIVLMTIDTNTPGDQVNVRDDALLDALLAMQEENSRPDSPLFGMMSEDRYGLSGWSMGGGGTWLAVAAHPELKSSMSLAGHDVTAGGASIASGTAVPSIMFAGAVDPAILGGGGQSQGIYEIIPETTPKILYEMAGEGHLSWGAPTTNGSALGLYALAFQKVFLEGDERYTEFLLTEGPGASDWRSNLLELGY